MTGPALPRGVLGHPARIALGVITVMLAVMGCTQPDQESSIDPSASPRSAIETPGVPDVTTPQAPTESEPPPFEPPDLGLEHPSGAVGYGAATTGGGGGDEVWVTSLEDSGPGTLRSAAGRSGPTWIRFAVEGTIRLRDRVPVGDDTTIDGRGTDVTISGDGLWLDDVNNVIITGLTFTDGHASRYSDAIWVYNGSSRVWITHNDFSDYADGLVDITYGATDITVSWNRFADHGKVLLVVWPPLVDDFDGERTPMRVTIHHNWFHHTETRNPLVRYADVHAFNNYVDQWQLYGMEAQSGSELYSEHNVFRADADTRAIISRDRPEDALVNPGRGLVRSDGDVTEGDATIDERDPDDVFDPRSDYDYVVDPAGDQLVRAIEQNAGVH